MKKLVIAAALLMGASFIIPAMAQVGTDSSSTGGLQGIFDQGTAASESSMTAVSSAAAQSSTPTTYYSSSSSSTRVGGFSSSSASSRTPGLPNTGEGGMAGH
jgi:hypothetical protein